MLPVTLGASLLGNLSTGKVVKLWKTLVMQTEIPGHGVIRAWSFN